VLFLQRCLLVCLCFIGATSHNKVLLLIGVGDEIVVQVLGVIVLEMGAARLIWRRNERHTLRHILRLIKDLLHVHRTAHMVFDVN